MDKTKVSQGANALSLPEPDPIELLASKVKQHPEAAVIWMKESSTNKDLPEMIKALAQRFQLKRIQDCFSQEFDQLELKEADIVSFVWEKPVSLTEFDLPDFPLDALPDWLAAFVEREALFTQTPTDLPGLLALGAISLSVAGRVEIEAGPGWIEPLNTWTCIAMESGERKTPVVQAVFAPVYAHEVAYNGKQKVDRATTEMRRKVVEDQLKRRQQSIAEIANVTEKEQALSDLDQLAIELTGMKVPEPLQLISNDVTPESLPILMQAQEGRLAIVSAEGGLFDTMAGRYNKGIPNLDAMLQGYSGEPIRVNRVGRATEYVPKATLTLALAVQPDVVRSLAQSPALRGRGFLARFLYALPKTNVGYRDNNAPPVPQGVLQKYQDNLRALLELEPDKADDGQTTPHRLKMTNEAAAYFIAERDEMEQQLRPGGSLYGIKDWGNKLCGNVARIAGLLHLAEHVGANKPWQKPVSLTTMQNAIRLGRYCIPHAQAMFAEMGMDVNILNARYLLPIIRHLCEQGNTDRITQRDLHHATQHRFRQVSDLQPVVTILEERHYLRKFEPMQGVGRHSIRLVVNPTILGKEIEAKVPTEPTKIAEGPVSVGFVGNNQQPGEAVSGGDDNPNAHYLLAPYADLLEAARNGEIASICNLSGQPTTANQAILTAEEWIRYLCNEADASERIEKLPFYLDQLEKIATWCRGERQ